MLRQWAKLAIAPALLVLVAVVHYGLTPLAQHLAPDEEAADALHRALFYVAQGLKGFALWVVIACIAPRRKAVTFPLFAVCAWGAFEDFQVAACRLARGIANVPTPGPWRGVCDDLTGLPLYMIGLFVGLFVACIVERGSKKDDRRT